MPPRRRDLPEGASLGPRQSNSHYPVLGPDGEPLRLPSGIPIRVSINEGDYRTRRNELARIRRALQPPEAHDVC